MFADWDCIFRKPRAGGDGRDKPGHDGVGESIISALGIIRETPVPAPRLSVSTQCPRCEPLLCGKAALDPPAGGQRSCRQSRRCPCHCSLTRPCSCAAAPADAVMFHQRDLPAERANGTRCSSPRWAALTRTAGSSTAWAAASRRCRRSASLPRRTRDDADVDYTFAQVQIREAARGLPRQLRQHELGRRTVRGRRGAGAAERRYRDGADLQHQHQEDHPLDVPAA